MNVTGVRREGWSKEILKESMKKSRRKVKKWRRLKNNE